MKLHSYKDGHDDCGSTFEDFEDLHRSCLKVEEKCKGILEQYLARRAKLADTQYWKAAARKNGGREAQMERYNDNFTVAKQKARAMVAYQSNRIALERVIKELSDYQGYLSTNVDTWERDLRHGAYKDKPMLRCLGINNLLLGKALHARLSSLLTKMYAAIEVDITGGMGQVELVKAYEAITPFYLPIDAPGADATRLREDLVNEDSPIMFSLCFEQGQYLPWDDTLVFSNSTTYSDDEQWQALVKVLTVSNDLIAQAHTEIQQLELAKKSLNERQYEQRLTKLGTKNDEARFRLKTEQTLRRCEVASIKVGLALLVDPIKDADSQMLDALLGVLKANNKNIQMHQIMLSMNNWLAGASVRRDLRQIMTRVQHASKYKNEEYADPYVGLEDALAGNIALVSIGHKQK
ncbi:MAG: hypothetical protein K2X81_23725 [Candidatus Obscuribacterales bacterium]|nr:hypothetical protein [Candidatus Obscuribacterales bacterium]